MLLSHSAPKTKSERRIRTATRLLGLAMPLAGAVGAASATADPVAPTSVGPAITEAGPFLWQEGREAFGRGQYDLAARSLQRLIDRHPEAEGYLEAHLLLGLTRLRLKQTAPAIRSLRHYIEASGWSNEALRARLSLGRAYLADEKPMEAMLAMKEILDRASPMPIRLEALLVKSRAMLARDRLLDARRALDSFEAGAKDQPEVAPLLAEAGQIELDLKLIDCASLPGTRPVAEELVINRIRRRSACLLEALTPFRRALTLGDAAIQNEVILRLGRGFADYRRACLNPPARPGRQTRSEAETHRKELSEHLMRVYGETVTKARSILSGWKGTADDGVSAYFDRALGMLKE